jgi:hypothetical protein
MTMEMLIITQGEAFSYIRESDHWLMRVKFINDRILYITLRGHWCDTVLNVHAPTGDKNDDANIAFMWN